MSLKSKRKVTCTLKIPPNAPKDFNHAVRKVLGLIISNLLEVAEKIETPLQKEVPLLCDRSDIVKSYPEMSRMVVDSSERENTYLLGIVCGQWKCCTGGLRQNWERFVDWNGSEKTFHSILFLPNQTTG